MTLLWFALRRSGRLSTRASKLPGQAANCNFCALHALRHSIACHVDGNVLTACGLSRAGREYVGLRSHLLRLAGGGSLGPSMKAIAPI
jgi:glyoxylate carboligase